MQSRASVGADSRDQKSMTFGCSVIRKHITRDDRDAFVKGINTQKESQQASLKSLGHQVFKSNDKNRFYMFKDFLKS